MIASVNFDDYDLQIKSQNIRLQHITNTKSFATLNYW